MSTSRIPAVLDALVTQVTSAVGSTGTVYDGPPSKGSAGASVVIGVDREGTPLRFSQSWAGIGDFRRDEEFDIPCEIRVFGGNSNHKTYRDQAFTLLGLVENLLRADPSLGVSGFIVRAEMGPSGDLTQTFGGLQGGSTGPVSLLFFTVHVMTRI